MSITWQEIEQMSAEQYKNALNDLNIKAEIESLPETNVPKTVKPEYVPPEKAA